MSDQYHDPRYKEAREKLTQAIRDFVSAVTDDSSLVLASTMVIETTSFDEAGDQTYSIDHSVLDGSLAHSAGLLHVASDRLTKWLNEPNGAECTCEEDDNPDG